jgi:hypothetical protein
MTPDEVVNQLENDLIKYNFTVEDEKFQKIIISLIQDYQKLRERGNKDNGRIRAILIRFAKEILSSRPPLYPSPEFIEETITAIVTYLQQPTEH